jgi:HSP20 family protein
MIETRWRLDENRQSGHFAAEDASSAETPDFGWRVTMRSPTWRPPTDVCETENAYMVRVEIAGMREEDFVVTLDNRLLNIRGIRTDQLERRAFHQMEIRFGEFAIDVELPARVDAARVQANYLEGFLRVTLPKFLPHQVKITE